MTIIGTFGGLTRAWRRRQPKARASRRRRLASWVAAAIAVPMVSSSPVAGIEAKRPGELRAAEIVGRVGDLELTLGELMFRFANLPEEQRRRYLSSGGLEAFLDDTLSAMAVARRAGAAGLRDDPLFAPLLALAEERVLADLHARRQLLAGLDEAALRARYEEQKEARFLSAERLHLRYLLVAHADASNGASRGHQERDASAAEREIRQLAARLRAGEELAELARLHSDDASAADGGDLGWVDSEDLQPEVAGAATGLRPGECSPPFESPLGWHLVQLIGRREAGIVPFEAVRELLLQEMVGERWLELAERSRRERQELLGEDDVERFPERLP